MAHFFWSSLYIKGADNVIQERMDKTNADHTVLSKTYDNLYNYALIGLRTLLLARKELTKEEYA